MDTLKNIDFLLRFQPILGIAVYTDVDLIVALCGSVNEEIMLFLILSLLFLLMGDTDSPELELKAGSILPSASLLGGFLVDAAVVDDMGC